MSQAPSTAEESPSTQSVPETATVEPTVASSEVPPAVEVTDESRRLIGVKTSESKIVPMKKTIRALGRIEYDEKRLYTINTKFEGWIEKLHVNYTGRPVKRGEPLAELYSPELLSTQREFLNMLGWANSIPSGSPDMVKEDANVLIEAARDRLRLWDITDKQIDKIAKTGKPLKTLTVYSPASGIVIEKMAVQGMKVMPGEKLFDIADISSLWVIADVYENDMQFIRKGQTAKITTGALPGKEFSLKADYIYPALSEETRTMKVRFTVPNEKGLLRPLMFAETVINVDIGNRLAVPSDAIINTGERQIVYVDKGDGYFEPREVISGAVSEGMTEIMSGLSEGEKVASSAAFLIDSEAQFKGVKPLPLRKR